MSFCYFKGVFFVLLALSNCFYVCMFNSFLELQGYEEWQNIRKQQEEAYEVSLQTDREKVSAYRVCANCK